MTFLTNNQQFIAFFVLIGSMLLFSFRLKNRFQESKPTQITFSKGPCQQLSQYLDKEKNLSPPLQDSLRVLMQSCAIRSQAHESPEQLTKVLPMLAPPDIASIAKSRLSIQPEWSAIALFPIIESKIKANCSSFPKYCHENHLQQAKDKIDTLLADMISNYHDLSALRSIQFGCTFGTRAKNVAHKIRSSSSHRAKVAQQILHNCALPRAEAIQTMRKKLTPEQPLLAIIILELHRLQATECFDDLKRLHAQLPEGLEKALIQFSLEHS